jgi:CRISPR-associated protein Cmr4
MFDKSVMLYLYVETSLHAGSGTGLGAVDLPIQRERVTGYPLVQASGVKGKLRAEAALKVGGNDHPKLLAVFGPDTQSSVEYAGSISPGDARLLLFPVRSLLGVFAWTTSANVLARFGRDAAASGQSNLQWILPQIEEGDALVAPGNDVTANGSLVLEEFAFKAQENDLVRNIAEQLRDQAFPDGAEYQYWKDKLSRSLVILPENAFRDFTQFSTEVISRIKLNPETKTVASSALWTEEHLPSDTLLYTPIHASKPRKRGALASDTADEVLKFITDLNLDRVQLGGDETTGRGLVRLRWA